MSNGLSNTQVLRYLNMRLGTVVQKLELSQEEIMRIVHQESLLTFSKYFPYIIRERITPDREIGNTGNYNIHIDGIEILGVVKVYMQDHLFYGHIANPLYQMHPIDAQISDDILSKFATPRTWRFKHPNILEIYPKLKIGAGNGPMVEMRVVHPPHLKTIPMNMRDRFLQLCLLDVLIALYPIRKRFEVMSTPYAEITPFMEMVERAQDDRSALIEQWQLEALRNSATRKIFIY